MYQHEVIYQTKMDVIPFPWFLVNSKHELGIYRIYPPVGVGNLLVDPIPLPFHQGFKGFLGLVSPLGVTYP
jgi:hypothetical protein